MKKQFSVLLFLARNKIYKVLAVLLAMAAGSIGGFCLLGFRDAPSLGADRSSLFLGVLCLLGYVGCILACTEFPSGKSRSGYTWQRLQISEQEVLLWDMLINILIFLTFYAAEILVLFTVAGIYAAGPGYAQGPQGIVAAFYRSAFLHGMIPLAERGLWVRNLLFVLVTAAECACSSLQLRYNRKTLNTSFRLAVGVALQLPKMPGQEFYLFPAILVGAAFLCFVLTLLRAHDGKRRQEDEA